MGKIIVRKRDHSERGKLYVDNRIVSTFDKKVYFGDKLKEAERVLVLPKNNSWELIDEKDA